MIALPHALWFPFFILSFLFKSLETNSGMFGKAETLVEKYPVFFFHFEVANKFYSQRQNIRCTQQKRSSKLKKKKRKEVWFFCVLLFASLSSLAFLKAEDGFPLLLSITRQMNLILELNAYSRSCINPFLSFQTQNFYEMWSRDRKIGERKGEVGHVIRVKPLWRENSRLHFCLVSWVKCCCTSSLLPFFSLQSFVCFLNYKKKREERLLQENRDAILGSVVLGLKI